MMKNSRLTSFLNYLLFISMTCVTLGTASANDLVLQRWQFKQGLEALKTKDFESFQESSTGLQDYPLYYYLRYQYLKPRLSQLPSSEIEAFLRRYGDTYFGDLLRRDWLTKLARQGNWRTIVRIYTPQKSTKLQCHYTVARLMTGQQRQAAIRDAKELWLVGHSQPNACDPAFEYLYQRGLVDDTMIWQRIELAMNKGRLGLTKAMAKRLSPTDQVWAALWQTMHRNPAKNLADFEEPDLPIVRKIVLHGINRLARKNFGLANEYWNTFQTRYAFSAQQVGEMQRDLALASVKRDHPQALKWLAAVHQDYLTEKVSETRIKLALKKQDWHAVADFTTELLKSEPNNYRWRYWQARALEKIGKRSEAQQKFQDLAKVRDYYGFLAADRIGAEHQMQHQSIVFSPADKTRLMKNNSIKGAYEFFNLSRLYGENKWLLDARREWQHGITHLTPSDQAIAAALASRWNWYDRAIMAAAKSGYYDDLDVRFPLAFYRPLEQAAKTQGVDLAWAYGITRQESAFMSDVRSRAGALGLMQLMPATGRLVARKIGLRLRRTRDILDVETNVSLGTAYLRQMLDKFDGNYMLATAAYNAGPGRSVRWAAKNGCMPADMWVEMIPFNETRKYVRRVLFYTSIFEARLGQRSRPLRLKLSPNKNCPYNYTRREQDNPNS
jgi:soluble lytic murein transglycosylase